MNYFESPEPFLIAHVLQHYVDRDIERQEWGATHRSSTHDKFPLTVSFLFPDGTVSKREWDATKGHLDRAKRTTVEYLHTLLHREPVHPSRVHQHLDMDEFRYIIEEEGELWTASLA